MNKNNIYLITVFEKCDVDVNQFPNVGYSRSVGFRHTMQSAEEVVKNNMCDICETCYHYACIEEIGPELYPYAKTRKFYQYNKDVNRYEEIDEPPCWKGHGPVGGIG